MGNLGKLLKTKNNKFKFPFAVILGARHGRSEHLDTAYKVATSAEPLGFLGREM